ncbi:sigma-54-dependent Fis family transcriptional regulator [Pseudochelatococcus sp. B33]
MNERKIRQAWESFVSEGHVPPDFRQDIAESWVRSRGYSGIARRRNAPKLPEPELYRRKHENRALLNAARRALARTADFLADANSMIILTDAAGLIIETRGDPRVIDSGRDIHLERGGRWAENDIGTNAIGTAIAVRRPVQIHAAEHYCEDVQRWTCAASPIRHPVDQDMLGVVDISGPVKTFNPQSLALAVSVSQQIEALLLQNVQDTREELLRVFLSRRSRWQNDEIVVLDSRGAIIYATDAGLAALALDHPDIAAGRSIDQLRGVPLSLWQSLVQGSLPSAEIEIIGAAQRHGMAEGQSLTDGQIGAVLTFPSRRRARPAAVKAPAGDTVALDDILGESPAMRETFERVRRMAASRAPVLIEGETGVGKELFARAIHAMGAAAGAPFIPVNCGGMSRDLIASEIFGYEKGAFTGADDQGRAGRMEAADGGTLCLDEVGEMPMSLQPYLLRVLEDGVVYRVGSNVGRSVNVRLISMTNRDMLSEVDGGNFRRDLYYRIATLRLVIPPLRERGDDVLLIAEHMLHRSARAMGLPTPMLDNEVRDLFRRYPWPGNVRELRNVVENMVVLGSAYLTMREVPGEIVRTVAGGRHGPARGEAAGSVHADMSAPGAGDDRLQQWSEAQRAVIERELAQTGGNISLTAKRLGIARSTLYAKLDKYGFRRDG